MTVCWVHPPLWWGLREETRGRGGSFLIFLAESLWNTSVEMTEFALPGLKSCCSVPGKSSWFPSESCSHSFSPSFHLDSFPFFCIFCTSHRLCILFINFPLTSHTPKFPVSPSRWASSSLTKENSVLTSLQVPVHWKSRVCCRDRAGKDWKMI